MNQSVFPKKGRATREVTAKPSEVFNPYDGTAGTKALPSTQRLCRSDNSSLALEEWTDWNGTRRTHQGRCMYKADTSPSNSQDPISRPLAQKEARPALPLISNGAAQAAAVKTRTINKSTDVSHSGKTFQEKLKSQPIVCSDMTPWVNASPSENSLSGLIQTIPSPRTYFDNMADERHSQRAPKNAVNKDGSDQLLKDKTHSRAKQKGRAGVTKRRTISKFHSIKLPPVPAVTELSFSRNFSFSFFDLPQHQSPQHWLQRQRSVYLLMRQLQ